MTTQTERQVRMPSLVSMPQATALVLFSAACFGSVVILTSLAMRAGARLPSVLAYRYLVGALMLVLASGGVHRTRLPTRQALRLVVVGGGGQAAIAFLSLKALDYALPAAAVAFLFYTYPAWVTIFAALRGSERVDATRATALLLSLGGIVVMVGSPWSGRLQPAGVMLVLAAAIVYALYIPLLGRLQGPATPAAASAHVAAGAGLLFLLGGAATGQFTTHLAASAWFAILVLALFSTTLAFIAFLRGLARLGPVRTAIISTAEPFWTTLLGALVLQQPMSWRTLAGGAMIAAAVLVLQRSPAAAATA